MISHGNPNHFTKVKSPIFLIENPNTRQWCRVKSFKYVSNHQRHAEMGEKLRIIDSWKMKQPNQSLLLSCGHKCNPARQASIDLTPGRFQIFLEFEMFYDLNQLLANFLLDNRLKKLENFTEGKKLLQYDTQL